MCQKKVFFRAYLRGAVVLLPSESDVGDWILGVAAPFGHIKIETTRRVTNFSRLGVFGGINRSLPMFDQGLGFARASSLMFLDNKCRVEDAGGKVMAVTALVEFINASQNKRRAAASESRQRFSSGAKRRSPRGSVYRVVATQNERRQNLADAFDGDAPQVRGARLSLPSYREGIYRFKQRSWKEQRRNQYKVAAPSSRRVEGFPEVL